MSVSIYKEMKTLEIKFKGVRSAARACGIDESYWVNLRDGKKKNPSRETLSKIGLVKIITYRHLIK